VRLLDAATVTTGTGDWNRGKSVDDREAGLSIYLADCDPDVTSDVIGDDGSIVCPYRTHAFPLVATLRRNSRLEAADDPAWLKKALAEHNEMGIGMSLLVQQGLSDVYLGNPEVLEIADPGVADMGAFIKALSDARKAFFQRSANLPIMHVHPDVSPALRAAGVIVINPQDGQDYNAWGDPTVISEGYYDIAGCTPNPRVFFTGPISITLSDINEEEIMRAVQQNQSMIQVTQEALIDTSPRAMVRLGAAPEVIVATGATAGAPGSYTPTGAKTPSSLDGLATVTASPATEWTPGQYVPLLDGTEAFWNGTAWADGRAPAYATGATAGAPGSYTPAGSQEPLNLAGLTGVTASPATAWTTGQYVSLQDGSKAHWSGTAWVAGIAA